MLELAISSSFLGRRTLGEEDFRLLAEGGIEHIEMAIMRHRFNYDDPGYIESVLGWVGKLGLNVPLAHAPLNSPLLPHEVDLSSLDEGVRKWAWGEMVKGAEIAARLGAKTLVVHAGTGLAEGEDPEPRLLQARRSVEELVSFCVPRGIRLAVENLMPGRVTGGAEGVREFIEDFDPQWVGICLDIGHAQCTEGAVAALEVVKDRLFTFHISDSRGRTDGHLMPFRGEIDWPAFMKALARRGYGGYFTYEVLDVPEVKEALSEVHRTFRELSSLMKG